MKYWSTVIPCHSPSVFLITVKFCKCGFNEIHHWWWPSHSSGGLCFGVTKSLLISTLVIAYCLLFAELKIWWRAQPASDAPLLHLAKNSIAYWRSWQSEQSKRETDPEYSVPGWAGHPAMQSDRWVQGQTGRCPYSVPATVRGDCLQVPVPQRVS